MYRLSAYMNYLGNKGRCCCEAFLLIVTFLPIYRHLSLYLHLVAGVIVLLGEDLHSVAVYHLAVATANHPPIMLVAVIHRMLMGR